MEEEYYKKSVEGFEVVTEHDKDPEPFMVTSNGIDFEQLKVTTLKIFTDTVKATEELSEKERSSVLDYISDNADLVSGELESFVNDQEAAVKAHDYLTSMFVDFPSISELADVLIQVLLKLLGG
ncbi:hypothetical protein [Vibrio aestuarianus]|uniref:hypothetical protein n=1 Tax=Vibrio aestuarianus TaxID=28171 RepID=UPI00237CCBF2|nr:hypothetical protein [Vibrio aestuarianus]MDE1222718.1 hypothetical protein [Vibrio aestuarianus]MDE1240512.1 hypothetical protein [Vibrio aestuarianus]